jgi:O-antigen ligase
LTLPLWIFWAWNYVFVWKGGWVPALVGLVFLLWFKYRRFVTIGLVVAVIFVVTNWGVVQKNLLAVETTTGSDIRPLYWYYVIRMTSSSVLLGLGPANYAFYWRDPTFVPLSRIAAGWDKWNAWGYAPPSHNMYVDVYAQTGLIGLGFFVWGIIAALLLAYRLRTRFPAGFLQAYVYGVLCGFASLCISSFLFADWLLPFVYNITITGFSHSVYSWLLLGTLVALDHSHEANHEPVA